MRGNVVAYIGEMRFSVLADDTDGTDYSQQRIARIIRIFLEASLLRDGLHDYTESRI